MACIPAWYSAIACWASRNCCSFLNSASARRCASSVFVLNIETPWVNDDGGRSIRPAGIATDQKRRSWPAPSLRPASSATNHMSRSPKYGYDRANNKSSRRRRIRSSSAATSALRNCSRQRLKRMTDAQKRTGPGRSRDEIDEVADGFRLLQADIRKHVDQLDQLVAQRTAELEAKSAELEAASAHKSQFLANMSHELRTPLNAIIGVSEMQLEDARDLGRKDAIEPLERILRAAQHLLALINDILDLSKIDAGKMEVHLESVDPAPLIEEIAATIRPLAEKNGNRVEADCATDLGRVH